MFEIIGILLAIYLVVGVAATLYLYNHDDEGGLRQMFRDYVKDRQWIELTIFVWFIVWCWPLIVIEHLQD